MVRFSARILAVLLGKLLIRLMKLLGGHGTHMPGVIVGALFPRLLAEWFATLSGRVILVAGTNGKTTTARILVAALRESGSSVVSNSSGANLLPGLLTALVHRASFKGEIDAEWIVLEADELNVLTLVRFAPPRAVLITNIFRDQLDRYGDVDRTVAIFTQCADLLPSHSLIVGCADDPRVVTACRITRAQTAWFAVRGRRYSLEELDGSTFVGTRAVFRPTPDLDPNGLTLLDTNPVRLAVLQHEVVVPLRGAHNAENVAAALTVTHSLGVPLERALAGASSVAAAFGRDEIFEFGSKIILLSLVKNPASFNLQIRELITGTSQTSILLCLDDRAADGRDLSWIWEVDFRELAARPLRVFVSGRRTNETALRMKYANVKNVAIIPQLQQALQHLLQETPYNGSAYCLCSYSMIAHARRFLRRMQRARKRC